MTNLPDEITTQEARQVSDLCVVSDQLEDRMCEYLLEVAEQIAEKHGLTEKQFEELEDRLGWRVEILPPQPKS